MFLVWHYVLGLNASLDRNVKNPRKNSGFSVIKSVARDDDENTLCHTLSVHYTHWLPERNPSERNEISRVWQLLLKHLRPDDPALKHPQRRSRRTKDARGAQVHAESTKSQFDHDQSLYSIASGSNDVIRRCREGLQSIPGQWSYCISWLISILQSVPHSSKWCITRYFPVFARLPRKKKHHQIMLLVTTAVGIEVGEWFWMYEQARNWTTLPNGISTYMDLDYFHQENVYI